MPLFFCWDPQVANKERIWCWAALDDASVMTGGLSWSKKRSIAYGEHTLHKVRVHVILDFIWSLRFKLQYFRHETSSAVIETFNRAFTVEPDAQPMIHTDRGSAYCSSMFNDYLASKNCIHSMCAPGHPWENSPIERWWNDFKLIWINKHPRPKTLAELEQLVKGAIEYFNTKRAYTSKNGLTAEQFRNQAA